MAVTGLTNSLLEKPGQELRSILVGSDSKRSEDMHPAAPIPSYIIALDLIPNAAASCIYTPW